LEKGRRGPTMSGKRRAQKILWKKGYPRPTIRGDLNRRQGLLSAEKLNALYDHREKEKGGSHALLKGKNKPRRRERTFQPKRIPIVKKRG